jgi:hypothetical protein
MLPPLLEVYVIWHPDDDGAQVADALIDHFHGTAFSGLVGGAIEVFVRSEGWQTAADAPRPLPFTTPLPNAMPEAELTVVVPVLGLHMAEAVETGGSWKTYVDEVVEGHERRRERVAVLPVRLPNAPAGGALGNTIGQLQAIYFAPAEDASGLCRDVAQAVAQFAARSTDPLRVFISHTKRAGDNDTDVPATLVRRVREVILDTRLREFFDASDLQPGHDWAKELEANAATSALLAIRTDLYATREWCQKEVLTAKRAGMPVVIVDALAHGEDRGSFLMDHVPRVPCRESDRDDGRGILRALGQLIDECLKRALWARQKELAEREHVGPVDWWAPHAPEPVTLVAWLGQSGAGQADTDAILVLHPDPPLGPDELGALEDLAALSGVGDRLEILTPRGLAIRGA